MNELRRHSQFPGFTYRSNTMVYVSNFSKDTLHWGHNADLQKQWNSGQEHLFVW